MQNIYDLRTATIQFEGNIVKINYKPRQIVEIEDAKEIVKIIAEHFPDESKPFGMLNDISNLKELSRQARDYFAEMSRPNTINAIVINRYLQSVLVKIYFTFSKPKGFTEIFDNEQDAMNWLKSKLQTT